MWLTIFKVFILGGISLDICSEITNKNFQLYILQYTSPEAYDAPLTSPNENFEYSYPLFVMMIVQVLVIIIAQILVIIITHVLVIMTVQILVIDCTDTCDKDCTNTCDIECTNICDNAVQILVMMFLQCL